jgi:hypothetical protein
VLGEDRVIGLVVDRANAWLNQVSARRENRTALRLRDAGILVSCASLYDNAARRVYIAGLLHLTSDWTPERRQQALDDLEDFETVHEVYRRAEGSLVSLKKSVALRPPRDPAELDECNLLVRDGERFLKIAYRIKDEKTRRAKLHAERGARFYASLLKPEGNPEIVWRYARKMRAELEPLPDLVNELVREWGTLRAITVQHHGFPVPDWVVLNTLGLSQEQK